MTFLQFLNKDVYLHLWKKHKGYKRVIKSFNSMQCMFRFFFFFNTSGGVKEPRLMGDENKLWNEVLAVHYTTTFTMI